MVALIDLQSSWGRSSDFGKKRSEGSGWGRSEMALPKLVAFVKSILVMKYAT